MSEFRRRLMPGKANKQVSSFKSVINVKYVWATNFEKILGSSFDTANILSMKIDGMDVAPSATFHFETTGDHIVECEVFAPLLSANGMFSGCSNTTLLDLSNLDTSETTNMGGMIGGCGNLETLIMPKTIKNVNNINAFISNAKKIRKLDLKGYKANISNIGYAFNGCSALEYLDLSDIDISTNANTTNVFANCTSLSYFNPFKGWKKSNLDLSQSPIQPLAVHQLIERASSVADGAVARTLTLNATTKTNWEASEYYGADQAMATEKNITIQ